MLSDLNFVGTKLKHFCILYTGLSGVPFEAHMTALESQTKSFDLSTFSLQTGPSHSTALLVLTTMNQFFVHICFKIIQSNRPWKAQPALIWIWLVNHQWSYSSVWIWNNSLRGHEQRGIRALSLRSWLAWFSTMAKSSRKLLVLVSWTQRQQTW